MNSSPNNKHKIHTEREQNEKKQQKICMRLAILCSFKSPFIVSICFNRIPFSAIGIRLRFTIWIFFKYFQSVCCYMLISCGYLIICLLFKYFKANNAYPMIFLPLFYLTFYIFIIARLLTSPQTTMDAIKIRFAHLLIQ